MNPYKKIRKNVAGYNLKHCNKCNESKARTKENFSLSKDRPDGLGPYCRPCANKIAKEFRLKNPDKCKFYNNRRKAKDKQDKHLQTYKWRIKTYFSLSYEQYEKMYKDQNGVCKICKKVQTDGRRLAVDHNHITGTIRGLLCGKCNRGLGYFEDNKEFLRTAVDYLSAEGLSYTAML